jgi:hypothetical protein
MKGFLTILTAAAVLALLTSAAETKAPAQFKASGSFSGGTPYSGMLVSGIRFGAYEDFTRMVIDLQAVDPNSGNRYDATAHPQYSVTYRTYPYRIEISLPLVSFDTQAKIQSKPAMPFSVVAPVDGPIKEMQVFLPGPSEFKVIEIDDPAKICIDVRPLRAVTIPTIYSVQIMDATSAEQAYALLESGKLPPEYQPDVLLLGGSVVLEQAFEDPAEAARIEDSLRKLGYQSVINERRGDELPSR